MVTIEIICEMCGGKANRRPCEVFRSKHHYCSHRCATNGSKTTRKGMKFADKHKQNLSKSHQSPRPYMKGRHPSEETKEKIRKSKTGVSVHTERHKRELSESMKAENHWNWKDGISSDRTRFFSFIWKRIAQEIRKRDRFVCQQCGKYPALDVHHIIPYRLTHNDNKNNLVTLCRKCHMQIERTFC